MSTYQPGAILNSLSTYFPLVFTAQHSGQEETEASRAYEFPKDIILEGSRTGRPGFTFYAVLPNHLMRVLAFIIFWSFNLLKNFIHSATS